MLLISSKESLKEKAINEKLQGELQATHKTEKEGRAGELDVVNILEGIVERKSYQ